MTVQILKSVARSCYLRFPDQSDFLDAVTVIKTSDRELLPNHFIVYRRAIMAVDKLPWIDFS